MFIDIPHKQEGLDHVCNANYEILGCHRILLPLNSAAIFLKLGLVGLMSFSSHQESTFQPCETVFIIGTARGAMPPPKYLTYLVIVCFDRRYPKQNTVARLNSNALAPPTFWAGYATGIYT